MTDAERVRWIKYPIRCIRCGAAYPDFFMVSDEEWKWYIAPSERRDILCPDCYKKIRDLQDAYGHKFPNSADVDEEVQKIKKRWKELFGK